MALYRNSWCIFFMILCTSIVYGEIGVNCGSGAVVGQPYTMECTNIPDIVNNGINVFLEGDVNSIITCLPSKNCASLDSSLYSVRSPHNESLFFTILKVTTDDIDKKLYCVDGSTLDSTSKPSCTLALVQTIEIGVNCGSGAVVGKPYTIECTNIPDTVNNGINVFFGDEVNSIITCFTSKNCVTQNTSLYSVVTPHNESLFFTILKVTTDDIDKKLYCVDGSTIPTSEPSCTLALVQNTDDDGGDGLPGGAIAVIVIGVILVCVVIIIIIVVIYKKKYF